MAFRGYHEMSFADSNNRKDENASFALTPLRYDEISICASSLALFDVDKTLKTLK